MMVKVYYLGQKESYIFEYNNSYYINKEDINEFECVKVSENYWMLVNIDKSNLKQISSFEAPSFDYIEFILEIKNVPSLISKNKIRLISFDNPSYLNDCRKTKVYGITTSFTKNILRIEFRDKEVSLAVHLLNENLENIIRGHPLFGTIDKDLVINKITYNNKILDEILIDEILRDIKETNLICVEFNKDIEEKSNLVVMVDDKYTYRPKVQDFLFKDAKK